MDGFVDTNKQEKPSKRPKQRPEEPIVTPAVTSCDEKSLPPIDLQHPHVTAVPDGLSNHPLIFSGNSLTYCVSNHG